MKYIVELRSRQGSDGLHGDVVCHVIRDMGNGRLDKRKEEEKLDMFSVLSLERFVYW